MATAQCTVRPASADDLEARLSLGDRPEPTGLQRRTWLQMMETRDLSVYLAEVEGMVVGTATVMTMQNLTYECAPTLFIEAVIVRPQFRRRGIASALLNRALDDARSAGCNKVQLLSHKRHATDGAHELYTKLGFEAEAEGFRLYLQEMPQDVKLASEG
jgi:ribosomal protein S18 acetylase RimI-like enzyme